MLKLIVTITRLDGTIVRLLLIDVVSEVKNIKKIYLKLKLKE